MPTRSGDDSFIEEPSPGQPLPESPKESSSDSNELTDPPRIDKSYFEQE